MLARHNEPPDMISEAALFLLGAPRRVRPWLASAQRKPSTAPRPTKMGTSRSPWRYDTRSACGGAPRAIQDSPRPLRLIVDHSVVDRFGETDWGVSQ